MKWTIKPLKMPERWRQVEIHPVIAGSSITSAMPLSPKYKTRFFLEYALYSPRRFSRPPVTNP